MGGFRHAFPAPGLNLSMKYKNFDLTTYFSGVYGNKIYNAIKNSLDFYLNPLASKDMLYEAGKSLPVLDISDNYSSRPSSYFVEDGSYLRCKNLALGYSIPGNVSLLKTEIRKIRIYLQVQNLFMITKYTGLDPEVTAFDLAERNTWLRGDNNSDPNQDRGPRDLTSGIDSGHYPLSKQFIAGMNIEF